MVSGPRMDDEDSRPAPATDVPPVPGPPPGSEADEADDLTPVNPGVMDPD
jgi:hypothetical protein